MTALQEFREKSFFKEETSDEQSILLIEIMNALGYSKREQEIHRHCAHLQNVLMNICRVDRTWTIRLAGSTAEGMRGGIHSNERQGDHDILIKNGKIKLYGPRANNINNLPCLPLHDNEDYAKSYFVEEDENFPGYVKLSLMEVNCTNMNDDKSYLPNSVKQNFSDLNKFLNIFTSTDFDTLIDAYQKRDLNGPALTLQQKTPTGCAIFDWVYCIQYDTWPDSAKSFITRRKPSNWPSTSLLENIQRQGCEVVPVGHHDSQNNAIQWRISFLGERSLLLDLTEVQILCYLVIKIILKETLNASQRELVSSFHIRHVIFWCVELSLCQWVDSNYINCLNICLTKLIQMIKARHIPHYIIESRNLFNSKMTEQMSKEIVDVLSKCDAARIFRLGAFECLLKIRRYNNALLKHAALTSTIMAGFKSCLLSFSSFVKRPSSFWALYLPHNTTESLLKYVKMLQHLNKEKGATIRYAKYVVSSMVGFLYYAKYKESNKTKFLLTSKRLIQKSLDLNNSCVTLRAATFFLTDMAYSQSIEICHTFLTVPPRYKIDSSYLEYNDEIENTVLQQLLFQGKTNEKIENIMNAILPMFYSSVKLKSLPGNYDMTQQNIVWIFRNLTNIYFHGLYMDVTFMTAEKWVVPDPILYELLSLPQNTEYGVYTFPGIYLDPMFVCLQTKLLCYNSIGNTNGMAEILTFMNSFIAENTFTTKLSYVYLNMFAYCQIKAGHHRQSVKSILQSLRIFPSRYNTASGYLKIVLQILNSLSF